MKRFRGLFSIARTLLLFAALTVVGVVVCRVFYPEIWGPAVCERLTELSCNVLSGSVDSSDSSSQWSKICGYWKDEDTRDCWFFDADGYGLYWDASESSEEQAATGSGKFKWKYDKAAGLMRYHWQGMFVNDYIGPDYSDPCTIIALTDERMEYTTVDGEYHSFIKITKP